MARSPAFAIIIVEIALYVVLDAVAQTLPPHYSPITQAESDLAVGPYGYIMAANFVNRGILSLVFLYALRGAVRRSEYRRGAALFGIWGVGALVLAAFPTDVPATPVSSHGAIHFFVAIIAFVAGAFGALSLSLGLGNEMHGIRLTGARQAALTISTLSVVSLLVMLALPFLAPRLANQVGGLTERVFLGTILLWMLVLSLILVRMSRRPVIEPSKVEVPSRTYTFGGETVISNLLHLLTLSTRRR